MQFSFRMRLNIIPPFERHLVFSRLWVLCVIWQINLPKLFNLILWMLLLIRSGHTHQCEVLLTYTALEILSDAPFRLTDWALWRTFQTKHDIFSWLTEQHLGYSDRLIWYTNNLIADVTAGYWGDEKHPLTLMSPSNLHRAYRCWNRIRCQW